MTAATPLPNDVSGQRSPTGARRVSMPQVLAALSHALDITEGQPMGHTVRACLLGMRLADDLRLSDEDRTALYYALLLKDVGCSANAAQTADLFGTHDGEAKAALKTVDWTRFLPAAWYGIRQAGRGQPLTSKAWHLCKVALGAQGAARTLVRIRCERGAAIVRKLGFPETSAAIVRALDEHWDGNGHPEGLRGAEIPVGSQIALVAQTIDAFAQRVGVSEALDAATARCGAWFDPRFARVIDGWRSDSDFWTQVYGDEAMAAVVAAVPPGPIIHVSEPRLDEIAEAFADVIDAKSPYTYRHSSGVANYARGLARVMGLNRGEQRSLYRAGLLHDIGKLAVSNRILDKQGALTEGEREIIQAHPVFTWTILSQVDAFAALSRTASLHHERLDGSGYPWGYHQDRLSTADRILAVADVYEALTARRPYREPMAAAEALDVLGGDVRGGELDGTVVLALERLIADGPIDDANASR